jgi:hypothetical protein
VQFARELRRANGSRSAEIGASSTGHFFHRGGDHLHHAEIQLAGDDVSGDGCVAARIDVAQGLEVWQRRVGGKPRACTLVETQLDLGAAGVVMRASGQPLEFDGLGRTLRDGEVDGRRPDWRWRRRPWHSHQGGRPDRGRRRSDRRAEKDRRSSR